MKYAKIVKLSIYLLLAVNILVFIYSLGFATDFHAIRSAYRGLFDEAQVFNRLIYNISAIAFIEYLLLIGMDNHNKTYYFWYNTVIGLLISIQTVVISIYAFMEITTLKTGYLKIDVASVQILFKKFELGTPTFIIGYIIFGLYLLIGLVILGITINNTKNTLVKRKDSVK